jgi:hypothetical protein
MDEWVVMGCVCVADVPWMVMKVVSMVANKGADFKMRHCLNRYSPINVESNNSLGDCGGGGGVEGEQECGEELVM